MSEISAAQLALVTSFPKLIELLRDKLDWPIGEDYGFDDVVYEYEANDLGLKDAEVAKIREIHQLRPLVTGQPWGIFFISFEDKSISVTVLRRILRALVFKKRASAQTPDRQTWSLHDLIFVTNFGPSGEREIAFAHFSDSAGDLPVLNVLGWNAKDTTLHNDHAGHVLSDRLRWPDDSTDQQAWKETWSKAFELRLGEVARTSQDLAKQLAALASNIRASANQLLLAETDKGQMRQLLGAFRKNLIHDLDEDGFADMFAQTISYGLLAAKISRPGADLVADNLADMIPKTNPFLKELFASFLKVGGRDTRRAMDFDELGVRNVVAMLNAANMDAVLRDFGDRNPKEDPVIHFYELFLKEYDPKKRMQRGVFYTPRPVVNFIVRGVDQILREEFGLPLGLADTTTWGELAARNAKVTVPKHVDSAQPFVQILDPATGTGTFLVEVIDLIHKRMKQHWEEHGKSAAEVEGAWNAYVPAHLLPRLTAFELMMAPYTIAHMKVGLKLSETGYTFSSSERARIFLTNALEPAHDLEMEFSFMSEALAHEAQASNGAKSKTPFTTVVGNPPYAGHSNNNSIPEIVRLVHDYKKDWPELLKPGQGKWLQDDYVKFIRLAQSLLDRTGFGVLGFITNHSFYDNPTFKGMRTKLKASFGQIRALDLHGNVKKSEKASDGSADGGVFEGVAQGVAITEAIKLDGFPRETQLWRDDLYGSAEQKLDYLIGSQSRIAGQQKCPILEPECFFYPVNSDLKREWQAFEGLPKAMGENGDPAPGIVTTHDEFAISFTEAEQIEKVEWLVATPDEEAARERFQLCTQDQWNYESAKRALGQHDWKNDLTPVAYRPFDRRVTVFNHHIAVHLRDRVMRHMRGQNNVGLISTRQRSQAVGEWTNSFVADQIIESTSISNKTKEINYLFPLWLKPSVGELQRRPNIDRTWARDLGKAVGLDYENSGAGEKSEASGIEWDGRGDLVRTFGPRDLFDYMYAVLHGPAYRSRYAEFLKSDFPHIPAPKTKATFEALATLGRQLVGLHLLHPEDSPLLATPDVRFAGNGDVRVEKGYPEYKNGRVMISATRWFEDVPSETWEFNVGGYQVCEKWLKDRAGKGGKNPSPGRVLTDEDILHYRRVVTALTETRQLMVEIDQVIEELGGWPGAFIVPPPPPPSIEEIIGADESLELEFKATFQWDVKEGRQNKELQKSVLKTLAAFMNTKGGTLVIGVNDDKEFHGLEDDLSLTRDSVDVFEQNLLSAFSNTIGVAYAQHISVRFAEAPSEKTVCVIVAAPSPEPVFLEFQGRQEFYVRRGNASIALNPSEQHTYVRQRFKAK